MAYSVSFFSSTNKPGKTLTHKKPQSCKRKNEFLIFFFFFFEDIYHLTALDVCLERWIFSDYIYCEANETEKKSFPTDTNGMKMSSISSVAEHITQSWLNSLLQLTNLINTLSPTDFLRKLLRFNELNLEVPMDQYGCGN